MSDGEYWRKYRSRLVNQIDLMRASKMNPQITHKDIRVSRQIRDAEKHLAMVEKLLAHSGQLE